MSTPDLNSSEQVATSFVAAELTAARLSLRRTRIGFVVAVLFVAGYMTFLLVTLQTHLLRPQPAAQLVTHYASQAVEQNGQALSAYLLKEVPAFIRDLPDQLISRLPALRQEIETKTTAGLTVQLRNLSGPVGGQLDSFLTAHQEEVKTFLAATKDPQFVQTFGDNLERELTSALQKPTANGKSVNDCLAEGLTAVRTLEARLDRLAHATDLTPEEKRLRRVVALTIKLTDRATTPAQRPAAPRT